MTDRNIGESLRAMMEQVVRRIELTIGGGDRQLVQQAKSTPVRSANQSPQFTAIVEPNYVRPFTDGHSVGVASIRRAPPDLASGPRGWPSDDAEVVRLDVERDAGDTPLTLELSVADLKLLVRFLAGTSGELLEAWLDRLPAAGDPPMTRGGDAHDQVRARPPAAALAFGMGYGEWHQWVKGQWHDRHTLELALAVLQSKFWQWREHQKAAHLLRRFAKIQRRIDRLQLPVAEPAPPPDPSSPPVLPEGKAPWAAYTALRDRTLRCWGSLDGLQQVRRDFIQQLPEWSAAFEEGWAGKAELHQIEARIAELAAAALRPPSQQPKKLGSLEAVGEDRSRRSPPAPVWPQEASATQDVALAGTHFDYAHGVLKFMGYRVGQGSTLTPERRRRILDYVFLGALPQVNDRVYMREWGRPKTSVRLRKLANAIAAFTRNARRRRNANLTLAINEWEEDLSYLRRRYYERRRPTWRWPETVRRRRR